MSAITIRVRHRHILRGSPLDGCKCPVALAIRDAMPGTDPEVDDKTIWFDANMPSCRSIEGRDWVGVPEDLGQWIRDFDLMIELHRSLRRFPWMRLLLFWPFTFRLDSSSDL